MPLLKRSTLAKKQTGELLRDDEEVFHCTMTNEIFKEYEEFAERIILCNSMVWTCALTGKTNLTFPEALESENRAEKALKLFPPDLRVPTLYITNLTNRSSFKAIASEVFGYMKDRFFIGEVVQVSHRSTLKEFVVRKVIRPDNEVTRDASIVHLEYKYEVESLESSHASVNGTQLIFAFKQMRRKRNTFTRHNLDLFLKQHVTKTVSGALAIKPATLDAFGITNMKFEQVFSGVPPIFDHKVIKHLTPKLSKQDKITKFLSKATGEEDKEKQIIRDKRKARNDEVAQILRDWHIPTEDLTLNDHKVLPVPSAIKSKIPDAHMGDVLCLMEFANCFSNALGVRHYFNGGLTLTVLERILFDTRAGSPMNDCVQMFLTAIFQLQSNESAEYRASGEAKPVGTSDTAMSDRCRKWLMKNLGNHLSELPLFTLTTSEILRLHLLASGESVTESGIKWRAQFRGGYSSEEDPAIHFRKHNPHIMKALAIHHMCQLSVGDKLKILHCLQNQMLTYKDVRESIKDIQDSIANAKSDLKVAQMVHRKRMAENTTNLAQLKKVGFKTEVHSRKIATLKAEEAKFTKEYEEQVHELGSKRYHRVNNMGQDRAGRSYIKLYSLPGLIVHRDDQYAGMCLSEFVPHVPILIDAERSKIKKYLLEVTEEMNSSDKENEPKRNGIGESDTTALPHTRDELLMCSTDPKKCPVHSVNIDAPQWTFCNDQNMLNDFIAMLNKRGVRENELRSALECDYQRLSKLIMRTPNYVADTSAVMQKRFNKENLGFSETLTVNETLRMAVVDQILDTEEKLFTGYLGGIQKNRDEFLDIIKANEYQRMEELARPRQKSPEEDVHDNDWRDPAWYINSLASDIKSQDSDDIEDQVLMHSTDDRETIKFLAFALVQIAMSVKPIFMLRPLGDSKGRGAGKVINRRNVIDCWEKSLLNATSYAQLLLFHSVFDNCIMWSKSTLVVKCKTCQKDTDDQKILLCDYCNDGYHLYCLKPKLYIVPRGEWYCINCVEVIEKMKAKRLQEEPMDSDSESEQHVCKVCGEVEKDDCIVCSTCKGVFHFDCTNLKRSVRGMWTCNECKVDKKDAKNANGESNNRRSGRNGEMKEALPLNNAALQELLHDVMKHEDGWPFVRPVPKYEVPDYYDIITKPMDFGTIKYKLNMGNYQFDDEVISDCQLVFENCQTYNSSDDEVFKCGTRLVKYLAKRCHELKIDYPYDRNDDYRPIKRRRLLHIN